MRKSGAKAPVTKTKEAAKMEETKTGFVYFILESEKDINGEYIVCCAKEGEKGYYRMDWHWGKDENIAQECANNMNEKMGYSKEETQRLICSTIM